MTRFSEISDPDKLLKIQKELLESICVMQQDFLQRGIYYGWCENTLKNLIHLTESEIGFICELVHEEDGTPFIKSHSISNIAWDEKTKKFYEEHYKNGLDFYNFDSLWGAVFTSGEAVIANDPDNDSRRGGYPKEAGHPPLKTFLGLPIKDSTGQVVGIMAVANRATGYEQELVDFLNPFLSSYGVLIEKFKLDEHKKQLEAERQNLINDLNKSLAEIKTLKGVIPICMHCKGIRDDKGYWNQLEKYIVEHSDAQFSHGICDNCLKERYPEAEE